MRGVTIIGAGLAGCEAAMRVAESGVPVTLIEQKPVHFSPAHSSPDLAELVCSNSLKADRLGSASGLLKAEMRRFGSLCLAAADGCRVPAGGALAVDRHAFARLITERIAAHPLITIRREAAEQIPDNGLCIIATGPLTEGRMADAIVSLTGADALSFYDAAAPIVTDSSINRDAAYPAARYGRGDPGDYLNCPLSEDEYNAFYEALVTAETASLHEADRLCVYEGCMPVEVMARRGHDTLRFGPLRPVGLIDPRTGKRPWAVVQLRREDAAGTLWNLVGFQTNLRFGEQKRVFSLIPALREAEFARYGVMHRNSFLDAPRLLGPDQSLRRGPRIFFAGQITGVEGYMESAASGIMAGIQAVRRLQGREPLILPHTTMMGALQAHLTNTFTKDYQPMGANFGLLPPLDVRVRGKQARYEALSDRALAALRDAIL